MKPDTFYSEPDRHNYLRQRCDDFYQQDIVGAVLKKLAVKSGESVVEVGAGTGRYTDLLVKKGLRVIATEPDETLFDELHDTFEKNSAVYAIQTGTEELPQDFTNVNALCGFHVLHHLHKKELFALADYINELFKQNQQFRGWFFLEPNPLNPLYLIQIAITPGMKFSEESGIWSQLYCKVFKEHCLDFEFFGNIGILPPQISRKLPEFFLKIFQPSLKLTKAPYWLYCIYGGQNFPR